MRDSYLTIAQPGESQFKDRSSKFIGHACYADSEEKAKTVLNEFRKKYHDARHHCFGWRLYPDYSVSRSNDDGEPGNSAGKPILNQIDKRKLTNTMVIVVRYFGGVKLGVGGLINAYKTAASEALDNANIIRQHMTKRWKLVFGYESINDVMRVLNDLETEIIEQNFGERCTMLVSVKSKYSRSFAQKIEMIDQCLIDSIVNNQQSIK